jgi:phosphotransferase system HPr (HPr) family protein
MPAKRNVPLLHRTGLHLRAAGRFAETANKFKATIYLTAVGRRINGKSVLDLLTLGAGPGTDLTIEADGQDAEQAVNDLVGLVQRNFDEEP